MGKESTSTPNEKPKKRLYEQIVVPLSDREVSELGIKQAEARVEFIRLEKEKHELDRGLNAKMKTLDALQDELAKQVNERQSSVDVEVVEVPDDGRKMIGIYRVDTKQLLRTREMTVQERGEAFTRRQGNLFEGTNLVDDADAEALDTETGVSPSNAPTDPPPPDDEPRDTDPPPPNDDDDDEGIDHNGQHLKRVPRKGPPPVSPR